MGMLLDKVMVGIVAYNPTIDRLKENVMAVMEQTSNIVIVNNGSSNYEEFTRILPPQICYINNEKNEGIAKALSQIMVYAKNKGYEWVLTLDQDSIIQSGLIREYLKYSSRIDLQDVGMFTCLIKDRNFLDKKNEIQNKDITEVPYCITSAAFTNVEKYFKTPGYDVNFFIDAVDFDICYSLRESGFRIVRINYMGLYHEVGHGENRQFLWKKIVVYHHSSFRIYYLARNTVLLYRKHNQIFPLYIMIKKELALLARIIFYENNKRDKLKQFIAGIKILRNARGER